MEEGSLLSTLLGGVGDLEKLSACRLRGGALIEEEFLRFCRFAGGDLESLGTLSRFAGGVKE